MRSLFDAMASSPNSRGRARNNSEAKTEQTKNGAKVGFGDSSFRQMRNISLLTHSTVERSEGKHVFCRATKATVQ